MEPIRDPEEVEVKVLRRLAALNGRAVLEIGCGDGRLTWRYADLAASVAGVDPDLDRLVDAPSARPQTIKTPVTFAQAQAEELPFFDEEFESAILAWSL